MSSESGSPGLPLVTHHLSRRSASCVMRMILQTQLSADTGHSTQLLRARAVRAGVHPNPGPAPIPKIAHWNCRSLNSVTADAMFEMAKPHALSAILLSETWQKCSMSDAALRVWCPYFTRTSYRGGGTGVLVPSHVASSLICEESTDQYQFTVVQSGSKRYAAVYINPSSPLQATSRLLETLGGLNCDVIAGDFNAHSFRWSNHVPDPDRGQIIVDWADLHGWKVTAPPISSKRGTSPDLCLTPYTQFAWVDSATPVLQSDHYFVVIGLSGLPCLQEVPGGPPRVSWGKVSPPELQSFRSTLEHCLSHRPRKGSLEQRHDRFVRAVRKALAHLPRGRPKYTLPGFTDQVRRLYDIALASGASHDITLFRRAYEVSLRRSLAKKGASVSDSASLWRLANDQPREPAVIVQDGATSWTSDMEQAEGFVELFAAKHRIRAVDPDPVQTLLPAPPPCVTMAETVAALLHPLGKSPDDDGISAEVLLRLPDLAIRFLQALFDDCLALGKLPDQWLRATVTPIRKPEKRGVLPTDYRPVAITSLLCRSMERIVLGRLLPDMPSHPNQYGFKKGRSTDMPLALLLGDARKAFSQSDERNGLRRQRRGMIIALDLTDAFCSVSPAHIRNRLAQSGAPRYLIDWVMSFLSGRTISVRVRGSRSTPRTTPWGVPQGSILGPPLFNLIMDELLGLLDDVSRQTPTLQAQSAMRNVAYADDVSTLLTFPSFAEDLDGVQSILDLYSRTVSRWATTTGIQISAKSSAMYVFARNGITPERISPSRRLGMVINGVVIKPSDDPQDKLRVLGVMLDIHLSFTHHAQHLLRRLSSTMSMIRRLRQLLPPFFVRTFALGKFVSPLLYAAHVWGPHVTKEDFQSLERLLETACRGILGVPPSCRGLAAVAECGLRPLSVMIECQAAKALQRFARIPPMTWSSVPGTPIRYPPPFSHWFSTSLLAPVSVPDFKDGPPRDLPVISRHLPIGPREPHLWGLPYRWEDTSAADNVHFMVYASCTRLDSAQKKREDSLRRLLQTRSRAGPAWELWTDGSIPGGLLPGGSAAVLFSPSGERTTLYDQVPPHSSSFSAEARALLLLSNAVELMAHSDLPLLIVSDSWSNLSALEVGPLRVRQHMHAQLWKELLHVASRVPVFLVFVFGHCGLERNDLADQAAADACKQQMDGRRLAWGPDDASHVCRALRATADLGLRELQGFRASGPKQSRPNVPRTVRGMRNRGYALLYQARVGVCPALGGSHVGTVANCPLCRERGVIGRTGSTIRHVFSCPKLSAHRSRWGIRDGHSHLWTDPKSAVCFLFSVTREFRLAVAPPLVA